MPWFDDFHKNDHIFIIIMDVIKDECGVEVSLIISIWKTDDGLW
jgi:hypothetical protein